MDKLRIALLCNGYGTTFRGAERYTSEIFELLKDSYDITIFSALTIQTKLRDEFKLPTRNLKAYAESYYFARHLYKHNVLDGFDLIINNSGFPGSYWSNKIRKLKKIPFLVLERGAGKEEKLNNLFKPDMIGYLTKHSYNRSKYKKKAHLPIGINVSDYQKKRKMDPVMKDLERPIYLSTSALVKFKRVPLIIDAVAKLEKGTLIQTSNGNMRDEICKYGKEKLGGRFQYVGKVSRDVLMSPYQHSDCFVSASKHEAFGVVYLEAMSSGLPVVTQYDERRKEIVGDAGVLVADCEDVNDFSSSLFYASKKDWGAMLMEQAKKYDWSVIIPHYKEVIEGVVR